MVLTQEEIKVLDKGLKFAPIKNINKFNAYVDINKFIRSLNIKKYMLNNTGVGRGTKIPDNNGIQYSNLKNKSLFNPPPGNEGHIEVFKKLVLKDLQELKIKKVYNPGDIKNGIKKLEARKDIVIRQADKGGAIVIQSKVDYNDEINRQLNDETTYQKLLSNPTMRYRKELTRIIQKGSDKGLLNKKESKYLQPNICRVPVIYTVPKVHKNSDKPPGRPIVNGINSVCARMGEYIDGFLQPVVKKTKSYLRDTKHLIQLLNTLNLKDGPIYLATADVGSLYTIINHEEAIQATKWALRNLSELKCVQRRFLLDCLKFSLDSNYFWFNSTYYKQICGIAMGAKFAPSVANLYMAEWEEEALYKQFPHQLILYKRYIDDIIIIWSGDRDSLTDFCFRLNTNTKNIKLTWEISTDKINFLDLLIKKEENFLTTQTYFKTVDRNSYLPLDSCHHNTWLENIPKGQLIRLRRNCSDKQTYMKQAEMIGERFIQKGYKTAFIEEKIQDIAHVDRDALIKDTTKKIDDKERVPIIMDFNVQHKHVEKIFKKHWDILKTDRHLSTILPERPKFTYRRAPTLRDNLAKNVLDPPPKKTFSFFEGKGYYPCKKCYACRHTKEPKKKKSSFTSTVTNKDYDIEDFITCKTEGVVYLMECPCKIQYIGRTKRELWKRLREHVQNIKKGFDKHSLSRHYAKYHKKDPSSLKICAIEKYKPHWRGDNKIIRISQAESRWIYELCTLRPWGHNVEFDLNCFISNY